MRKNKRPEIFVVKLGGSLVTHKSQYRKINLERVASYGRQLRAILDESEIQVVCVIGGGSLGIKFL